eukprot:5067143-Prymnesium_polylepis.1
MCVWTADANKLCGHGIFGLVYGSALSHVSRRDSRVTVVGAARAVGDPHSSLQTQNPGIIESLISAQPRTKSRLSHQPLQLPPKTQRI